MIRLLIFSLLAILSQEAEGQEGQVLHQYFNFNNGFYLTHQSLLDNKPFIALSSKNESVYNNDSKILRVNQSDLQLSKGQQLGYVVEQGLPYARVLRCCPDQPIYVGFTILGSLSVLSFESEEIVEVPMVAYNPFNNKPFLKGTIKREKDVMVTEIINMENGERYEMNSPALAKLLDAEKTFQDLDELLAAISAYNKVNKTLIAR